MWRVVALVVFLEAAAVAVACGGGGGGGGSETPRPSDAVIANETPECNIASPGPTFQALIEASFDEASAMSGFDVLSPEELPQDTTLVGPLVFRSGFCPQNVMEVQLMVRSRDFTIVLSQRSADAAYSDLPETITINGVQGSVDREHRGDATLAVTWADGERRYRADLLGDASHEARFLEILESIPD